MQGKLGTNWGEDVTCENKRQIVETVALLEVFYRGPKKMIYITGEYEQAGTHQNDCIALDNKMTDQEKYFIPSYEKSQLVQLGNQQFYVHSLLQLPVLQYEGKFLLELNEEFV